MVTCSYAQLRYVSTLVAKFAHQRISLRIHHTPKKTMYLINMMLWHRRATVTYFPPLCFCIGHQLL
ncbi:hypothetical protein [Pectobacterium parvum]|uniref:hypothetical protein n=1 Tax=Pectobacterium parvum TaxID=2778550 RepID=UPI000AA07A43|nr:hypothetical protein [Pectobacterium parvum]UVD99368.1 hypothetical protein NV347_10455 [Pectobacterium parvum]